MSDTNFASFVDSLIGGTTDTFLVCAGTTSPVAKKTAAEVRSLLGVYTTAQVDSAVAAKIGGSVGSVANRLVKSLNTDTLTVTSTGVTVDASNNVSGVGTISSGAITSSGAANSGAQVLRVQGSGGGFTRINDNGTVVINGDVGTGTTPVSVQYNGTEQWGFTYNGILSGRSGCTLNIGAGQMHLTHSGNISQIKTFGNLALLPGNLGGGGTSVNVTGAITASDAVKTGLKLFSALPAASASTDCIFTVTDRSGRPLAKSDGTNWYNVFTGAILT